MTRNEEMMNLLRELRQDLDRLRQEQAEQRDHVTEMVQSTVTSAVTGLSESLSASLGDQIRQEAPALTTAAERHREDGVNRNGNESGPQQNAPPVATSSPATTEDSAAGLPTTSSAADRIRPTARSLLPDLEASTRSAAGFQQSSSWSFLKL